MSLRRPAWLILGAWLLIVADGCALKRGAYFLPAPGVAGAAVYPEAGVVVLEASDFELRVYTETEPAGEEGGPAIPRRYEQERIRARLSLRVKQGEAWFDPWQVTLRLAGGRPLSPVAVEVRAPEAAPAGLPHRVRVGAGERPSFYLTYAVRVEEVSGFELAPGTLEINARRVNLPALQFYRPVARLGWW